MPRQASFMSWNSVWMEICLVQTPNWLILRYCRSFDNLHMWIWIGFRRNHGKKPRYGCRISRIRFGSWRLWKNIQNGRTGTRQHFFHIRTRAFVCIQTQALGTHQTRIVGNWFQKPVLEHLFNQPAACQSSHTFPFCFRHANHTLNCTWSDPTQWRVLMFVKRFRRH